MEKLPAHEEAVRESVIAAPGGDPETSPEDQTAH
jgi:hypothetical protein